MPDYRDPKVTTPNTAGGAGKWIGIALGVLVLLLLLWWLFGDTDEPGVADEPAAVETDPAAIETDPATTAPIDGEAAEPVPEN